MFRRVLVHVDAETAATPLLSWVRRLLTPVRGDVRLLAVRPDSRAVVAGSRTVAYADQREAAARADAAFALARLAGPLRDSGLAVTAEVRFGAPAAAVVAAAAAWGADVIALTARSAPGWRGWLAPSLTEHVLRSSPVPVLVVDPARTRAA